uniref:Uncharacterized protein n=1 Tax=Arundo donax TaxID=35708 RepID=A0A0A9GYH0_ARUDO
MLIKRCSTASFQQDKVALQDRRFS